MNRKIAVATAIAVATILACLAGASAARQNMNGNMGRSMNSNMSMRRLSLADRRFMMEAAMGGMMEVEMGRMATQRAASDAVRQFGQRMIDDHSRANEELTQLASSKGLTVPTGLDARHRSMMNRFMRLSGAAFDRAYMRDMVADHVKDVREFQRTSARANDSDVRGFATRTLPTLQEHLRMARETNGGLTGMRRANSNMNRP